MATVDKASYGLHPVALAEWQGLVWLNLAENPAPFDEQVWSQLDYRLGGDRAKFARYDLAGLVAGQRVDYTVAANWKIIQENFQECYHCATIHPELVDTLPQFRSLTGGADASYEPDGYYFAEDKASFSVSGHTILPRLPVGATISRHVGMLGTAAAPQEAWLVQRGIKTLPVRMRQICASSQRIAEFLATHPAIQQVHYPGLPGHPDHLLAAKQMPVGFGGVVSAELRGGPDTAGRVCERTRVFTLAVSLGSVESLIEHPARMTHCTTAGTPVGVSDCLLRLSIGLEDCAELIADLDEALAG
jgi:hypothetical protein